LPDISANANKYNSISVGDVHMRWYEIIGIVIMSIGILFIIAGMYGVSRYRKLGIRLVLAAKIDTAGLIATLAGAAFYSGWNQHSLKIIVIIFLAMITNPIITHAIAHSAWSSDYDLTGTDVDQEKKYD
jgi:multicomponent Na+:H+ antiporter subunit G